MALDYSGIAPATTPNPIFNFVDESAPGVADGTPLKASMIMELHTLFMRLIDELGEDYSNAIEQAVPASDFNSHFYRSLQKFTRTNAGGRASGCKPRAGIFTDIQNADDDIEAGLCENALHRSFRHRASRKHRPSASKTDTALGVG